MTSLPPLRRLLDGPPPALPAPLDAIAERWARLRPRARFLVVLLLLAVVAATLTVRLARSPWGQPVPVVVAARTLEAGDQIGPGDLRVVRWPASVVPPGALRDPAQGTVVGTVPEGVPLTVQHLGEGGLDALAAAGTTVVPLPLEMLPEVPSGARVDVIAADHELGGAALARDARVLAADDRFLWVEVPRDAAPDVAAAALRSAVVVALVPPTAPEPPKP